MLAGVKASPDALRKQNLLPSLIGIKIVISVHQVKLLPQQALIPNLICLSLMALKVGTRLYGSL
jgi:hypothetical protein